MRFLLFTWMILALVAGAQTSSDHDEFAFVRQQIKSSHGFVPKNGYVPDKDTAIAIAYSVAMPIYGKEKVDAEKPLRAELEGGTWIVLGTLHGATSGGTLIVQIDQATGRISYLSHSM